MKRNLIVKALTVPGAGMPAMPLFLKNFAELAAPSREAHEIDWNIDLRGKPIMAAEIADAIAKELDDAMAPAPKPTAARLAMFLVGLYPAREVTDPEIFAAGICHTFEAYPAHIGLAAIDEITRRSKWLPTRADLIAALDAAMVDLRYARQVVLAHQKANERGHAIPDHILHQIMRRAGVIAGGTYLSTVAISDVREMVRLGLLTADDAISAGYAID